MKKLIFVLLTTVCLVSNGQVDPPQISISNGLIRSLLYLPGADDGYYRGTRFDWSGVMASLEFAGHNFYGKWFDKYHPEIHDAVMGPVEEFGQTGFEEAETGGTFLKIGVGILVKPDEKPYSSFRLYPIKNGGKWNVKSHADAVVFTQTLDDPENGYVYEKEIRLEKGKPVMSISHSLQNKGKKAIETTVYNHNFPVIDKQPAGPGYTVTFPFSLSGCTGQGFGDVVSIRENKLVYLKNQESSDRVFCGDLKGYGSSKDDYDIRIENSNARAGIRITSDQPIMKLVYWSSPTTVCPEPYQRVSVAPGKKFSWNLRYEYYVLDPGR